MQPPTDSPSTQPLPQSDLGRRVAHRREELGLTWADVAQRAGAAPGYIEYVEQRSAVPDIGFLLRLSDALETTLAELTGGLANFPPGYGQALRNPQFIALDHAECWALLSAYGIGRLAVSTPNGPEILPLNYCVDDEDIAFRTAPGSVAASVDGHDAAFEVDHIDDVMSEGWSVLAVGTAHAVTAPHAVRHLNELAHSAPWAGGNDRTLWLTLTPRRITGRRIVAATPGRH
ncbi:helix-turn-helix domain-containing protein [Streptomyces sp. AM8-1-1]|uniref:helix-turn-helix domain-containing protein n=1 Tax=Streptomyces sp. AM8-1-1 TaxID=3075825 RepID=UPI0028C45C09|nr:pyridoxamine 5'-phosphate oxidase family protein [Streptomyces sp. AM8-1-1]WNO77010.1 pyridoxamine 5'-phosphate oxidase family protein [Streptomyces sp. AM8-1-1]